VLMKNWLPVRYGLDTTKARGLNIRTITAIKSNVYTSTVGGTGVGHGQSARLVGQAGAAGLSELIGDTAIGGSGDFTATRDGVFGSSWGTSSTSATGVRILV
jgi:hypothetical protein